MTLPGICSADLGGSIGLGKNARDICLLRFLSGDFLFSAVGFGVGEGVGSILFPALPRIILTLRSSKSSWLLWTSWLLSTSTLSTTPDILERSVIVMLSNCRIASSVPIKTGAPRAVGP